MARKLAHIEKIDWIRPIEGKDRIALAGVLGWTVIIQKADYNEGDKCIFCEIDSVFPEKPEYEFLRSKKFRIKTMKMSGVLSQGICFPMSMLPEGNYEIGDDVTEFMGITQYEPTMDKEETDNLNSFSILRASASISTSALSTPKCSSPPISFSSTLSGLRISTAFLPSLFFCVINSFNLLIFCKSSPAMVNLY